MPATTRRELDLERQVRVSAPLRLVWEEMGSLHQVLAKAPHLSDCEVARGGQQALMRAHLSWGPFKRAVEVEARLLGIAVERQIRYVMEAGSLEARAEIAIDLIVAGDCETRLLYRSCVEAGHKTAIRMWRVFREIAEEQADSLLQRVKVRSEQRRLAHERLWLELT